MDVKAFLEWLARQLDGDDYGVCPRDYLGDSFAMCDATDDADCVRCWMLAMEIYVRKLREVEE